MDPDQYDRDRPEHLDLAGHVCVLDLKHDHSLSSSAVVAEGYVYLEISGPEWEGVAYALTAHGASSEVYALVSDEYGTQTRFARSEDGTIRAYWIEEDGDESCQDDFEEEEYDRKNADLASKWRALIPDAVKQRVPDFLE